MTPLPSPTESDHARVVRPESSEQTALQRELEAANRRVAELENDLKEALRDATVATHAQRELAKLRADITVLQQSHSWRITAPLRRVSVLATKTRLIVRSVRHQIHMRGGLSKSLILGVGILHREGIAGVRKKLRRLNNGLGYSQATYSSWITQYDSLTPAIRAEMQRRLQTFKRTPSFSVIVPTYNSDPRYLREMIKSVREQIYPNWELCIADDASTDAHMRDILSEESAHDSRIKVCFRTENGHISEASNSALSLASGDFAVLLDHDDVLPEHALFTVAQYINKYPDARMFYSDEDKLTANGTRTTPYFKSDWNPEMFRAQNMFSHLGVFETALIREVGGFRKGFEGSQDHDLALRCVELSGHDKVVHIPHVLYHWRMAPGSTAGHSDEKPYALVAAIRAVEEHLRRNNIDATVGQSFDRLPILHVRYATPTPPPLVSLLIPTRDGVDLLRQCIDSVLNKTAYKNYEIIVVDNGSEQPATLAYFESIKQHQNIRVLRDESPFNFSKLNNDAVIETKGEYLCLLNNDIEVISPDWLDEMIGIASQPGNGAVGASLWYPDDTLQHGGVLIGLGGVAGHMHRLMAYGNVGYFGRAVATQNLSAVTAACLVIRKSIYEKVGGLDEELAVAFNDVDFCLRVREAGYRNVWTPHAQLYHHESATRGSDMDPDKYERFVKEVRLMESRWAGMFEHDPAYNPNLSLSAQVLPFTLADPPRTNILD
ncbi:glycosyltransferase family 2 protein [Paraburkholderia acidicola]